MFTIFYCCMTYRIDIDLYRKYMNINVEKSNNFLIKSTWQIVMEFFLLYV